MIQAIQINHPVLQYVIQNDYSGFYNKEIAERREFGYPPFVRLIRLTLKHSKVDMVNKTANFLAAELKKSFGDKILGLPFPEFRA